VKNFGNTGNGDLYANAKRKEGDDFGNGQTTGIAHFIALKNIFPFSPKLLLLRLIFIKNEIMKKQFSQFLTAALLLAGTTLFPACKDSSDSKNDTPTLLGKWEMVRETTTSVDSTTTPPTPSVEDTTYTSGQSMILEFKTGDTLIATNYIVEPHEVTQGTWSTSGNKLTMSMDGGTSTVVVDALTSSTLTATYTESEPLVYSRTQTIIFNRK
jgi:hypothetical protein